MPVNPEIGMVKPQSPETEKLWLCTKGKQRHLRAAVFQIYDFLTA
jgi:hypothetical protein